MSAPPIQATIPVRRTSVRWWILGLVFFGTTLNYLDRMVMGILAPGLQQQYLISDQQYGYIQSAFALSYAIGQVFPPAAWTRSARVWATGCRSWPGAWLPPSTALPRVCGASGSRAPSWASRNRPRFLAPPRLWPNGFPGVSGPLPSVFVNAGTNMGVIAASAVVPWLAASYGWQWAFIGTGALGFVLFLLWMPIYRTPAEHPSVAAAELAHINSDPAESAVKPPWISLVTTRQAWAFATGKFLTDSMWWFYVTWFPKYLHKTYNLNLLQIGLPLVVIYVICDLGSIGGGWLSSALIQRGVSVNWARKTALLVCALGVMPILFAQQVSGVWTAVLLLGLVTAAHQGFSSNLYTLVSDLFSRQAVASVAGLGGMCGYFGASLFQLVVGYFVEKQHNYTVPFLCAGTAYLLALLAIHALAPRLEPAAPHPA